MHLTDIYFWDGESLRSILAGTVLPTLHGDIICKNWYLCGVCWEECKRKKLHVPISPDVVNTLYGLLKAAQGD